jgi:hypothetical protein
LKVEKETRQNQWVKTQMIGETRIQTYEDQEREKRTGCDGRTITHSEFGLKRRQNVQIKHVTALFVVYHVEGDDIWLQVHEVMQTSRLERE